MQERHKEMCLLLPFNVFLPLSSEQKERSGMRCGDYFGNAGTAVVICDRQSMELVHVETSQKNCWFRKWPVGCEKRCICVWGKKVRQEKMEREPVLQRAEMGEACKTVKYE